MTGRAKEKRYRTTQERGYKGGQTADRAEGEAADRGVKGGKVAGWWTGGTRGPNNTTEHVEQTFPLPATYLPSLPLYLASFLPLPYPAVTPVVFLPFPLPCPTTQFSSLPVPPLTLPCLLPPALLPLLFPPMFSHPSASLPSLQRCAMRCENAWPGGANHRLQHLTPLPRPDADWGKRRSLAPQN